MTNPSGPPGPPGPPPGPPPGADRGVTFPIGKKTRSTIAKAAVVAWIIGIICVVAVIASATSDDGAPVGGVIAFGVIGLLFCAFAVLMTGGAISHKRNAQRWGEKALHVDSAGLSEQGNPYGPIFVPWSEFLGLEVVASDYGGGYNPYRFPSTPNSKTARGVMTALRMYPAHPDEFARRVPTWVQSPGTQSQQRMRDAVVDSEFGASYYTESDIREDLVNAIRYYTGGRLGQPVDETRRARYRGSQFDGGG